MKMENDTSMDDLLDANIDDLADLPEFKVFPPGVHKVRLSWEKKKIKGDNALSLTLTHVDTVELSDVSDVAPAPGDSTSVLFNLGNEFAQGELKKHLRTLSKIVGTSSINETLAATEGMEVTVVTKIRTDKKDATKKYLSVVSISE